MSHDVEPDPSGRINADDSARAVFVGWERLRLVYNLVLASIVLAVSGPQVVRLADLDFLVLAAIAANVCFCTGPIVEGYLVLLGVDRQMVRRILFISGLVLACLLTTMTLIAWKMPHFD